MHNLDIKAKKRRECERAPVPRPAPWLLFPYKRGRIHQAFVSIVDPNQTFIKRIPELSGKFIWGSYYGWLFLYGGNDHKSCSLFNPVSLESIDLPLLKSARIMDMYCECKLSSPPSNPNCTVFIIDKGYRTMLFCRPGDLEWTEKNFGLEVAKILGDASYHVLLLFAGFGGKLYACNYGGSDLLVFEVDGENQLNVASVVLNLSPNCEPYKAPWRSYFMESFGELLYVAMGLRDIFDREEVRFMNIFRFDFSQEVWVKVENLNDRALFLGPQCSTSCYATQPGIAGNNVYFCVDRDKSLYSYNLEDGSVSVSEPCPKLPKTWYQPVWVMPDLRITDVQRGRQECHIEDSNGEDDNEIIKHGYNVNLKEKQEVDESLWANLRIGVLLELVVEHLVPLDFMQFRAVCRRFRSVAPLTNWRTANLGTQTSPPFFVFLKHDDGVYKFTDSVHSDTYFMNVPEMLLRASIHYMKDGWFLLLEEGKSVLFFNPFTKEMKQIPSLDKDRVLQIGFSTVPCSSDFVAVAISFPTIEGTLISSWRPGEEDWNHTPVETFVPYNSPVFYNGAFYFLGIHGHLGVFTLIDGTHNWEVLAGPETPCSSFSSRFLVECAGEMLSVFVDHLGKWVRVFRLNLSMMVWVEVQSLGNRMLFVSNSSTFSMVASTPKMQNRIYFPRFHKKSIVFYSLETRKFHCVGYEDAMNDFCGTLEPTNCGWIQPRWLTNTAES